MCLIFKGLEWDETHFRLKKAGWKSEKDDGTKRGSGTIQKSCSGVGPDFSIEPTAAKFKKGHAQAGLRPEILNRTATAADSFH